MSQKLILSFFLSSFGEANLKRSITGYDLQSNMKNYGDLPIDIEG